MDTGHNGGVGFLRHAHVEIDLSRLGANMRRLRADCAPDCRVFAVVKGDAYGAGLIRSSLALEAAGVDALAVGSADDAVALRQAGLRVDILVYGSTPPDRAADLVAIDAIVTIHDSTSLQAVVTAASARSGQTRVMVKVDCGLARLGVPISDLDAVFSTLAAARAITVDGIYSHLTAQDDLVRVERQASALVRALACAARYDIRPPTRMLASSRVIFDHPALMLSAVDPGRLMFGLSRDEWAGGHDYDPVIARFVARIVQVSVLPAGTIPYGHDVALETDLRVAVVAAGTADGLVFTQPGQTVLVRGHRARQLGPPGVEHSMLDLTAVTGAEVGDEVVYFGKDGQEEITPLEFARFCGRPVDQALPLVGRLARRVYCQA